MKLIQFCALLLIGIGLQAQTIQGEIIYESKTDIHRNIPDEMSSLKERIPQFRTSKHILTFTTEEAVFKAKKGDKAEETAPQGRRRRFRSGGRNETEIYRDLTAGMSVESSDFFGKKFLISGEADNEYRWKMTGETKQVGDYLCQKAVFKDSIQDIFVWFTPMIPVAAGPENYVGLPGMVLYVNVNDGERIITATEINPKELEPGVITKPTEGKSISRSDYKKMRAEKMKEMQEASGGGNNRMMFRRG